MKAIQPTFACTQRNFAVQYYLAHMQIKRKLNQNIHKNTIKKQYIEIFAKVIVEIKCAQARIHFQV